VRQTQSEKTAIDLVYNEETGEFEQVARGEITEGTTITLRSVEFGGLTLPNVKASVVHNQAAPLLLGQTVLSRLGKIEIDYKKNVLKITHLKAK